MYQDETSRCNNKGMSVCVSEHPTMDDQSVCVDVTTTRSVQKQMITDLEKIFNAEYIVLVIDGKRTPNEDQPTMLFDWDEKRVSGTTGCNRYFTRFELANNNTLNFSEVASTRMACPDMSMENAFLTTLENVAAYHSSNDNTLHLNDATGKTIILLQRK